MDAPAHAEIAKCFDGTLLGSNDILFKFAIVPDAKLEMLEHAALDEDWGRGRWVLRRYLATHVPLAIQQSKYVWHGANLIITAGQLQTRYGTPLYLSFAASNDSSRQPPWYLQYVGPSPNAPELPQPPVLPDWPALPAGAEIIIAHDHILQDNIGRVEFLGRETPRVAQMCAIVGAIQWSLFRGLAIQQLYLGVPSYFVPLYLRNRENIAAAPDLVAPVQVQGNHLLVRTVLKPSMAYGWARVVAPRHDQLPPWLLQSWSEEGAQAEFEDVARIEGRDLVPVRQS